MDKPSKTSMGNSTITPDWPPPPKSHEGRRAAFVVIGVVVGLVVVMGGCGVVALRALDNSIGDLRFGPSGGGFGHPDVKPIPVSRASCPYLRRVRDTADAAGRDFLGGLSNDNDTAFRNVFALRLAAYDAALRAAIPRVPERISYELRQNLQHVRAGEQLLEQATSPSDYFTRAIGEALQGYDNLGYVSALTDNACGFDVQPPLNFPTTSATTGR